MRQNGHRVLLPRILFPGSKVSGVGGLLGLEVVRGTETLTMSFEVMSICQQRQPLVLLPA